MKRYYFFLILQLLTVNLISAQNNILFSAKPIHPDQAISLIENFSAYEIVELDAAALYQELGDYKIHLQLSPDHVFNLDLTPANLLSEDFRLVVDGERVFSDVAVRNVYQYLPNHSRPARITVGGTYVNVSIPIEGDYLFVEPLRIYDHSAPDNFYVLYKRSAVKTELRKCGVTQTPTSTVEITPDATAQTREATGCVEIDVSIATDHLMLTPYTDNAGVIARAESIMAGVQDDYAGAFEDDVKYSILEFFVSTSSATDPVATNITFGSDVLDAFRTWTQNGGFTNSDYDLAQFLTYRDFDGSTVGVAWNDNGSGFGVVCTASRQHIIQDNQISIDAVRATTSHEIGHNWSAQHDDSFGYNIMNASFNSSNPPMTWSSLSFSEISFAVDYTDNNRNCLTDCCDAGTAPLAVISTPTTVICEGNTISYASNSTNCPNSCSWTFNGGTPSVSTDKFVDVSYPTPGVYTTSLMVSGTGGNNTATQNIIVLDGANSLPALNGTAGNSGILGVTFLNISTSSGSAATDAADPSLPNNGNKLVDFSCTEVAQIEAGQTYTLVFQPVPGVTQHIRVYIDFNNDGDFDFNERLFNSNTFNYSQVTNVSIPITTTNNPMVYDEIIRMRIIVDDGASAQSGSTINGNGQAEDYGVVFLLTPLPVNLSDFGGQVVDDDAILDWTTESEENNDYFTLQRSEDGRNFENIATVIGSGNSNTSTNYRHRDKGLDAGTYYYRLTQTDFDGTTSVLGDIISLKVGGDTPLRIIPNPVIQQELTIQFDVFPAEEIDYLIYTATGQLVENGSSLTTNRAMPIHLPTLLPGLYYLKITYGGNSMVKKFVVK